MNHQQHDEGNGGRTTEAMVPTTEQAVHSFAVELAKAHGWKAAVVLKYLAFKLSRSKHTKQNRTWYYETLESLAKKFPYLKKSTLNDILVRLVTNKVILTNRFNKRGYDRTRWYAFQDEATSTAATNGVIYFGAEDATLYGVVEAVLLGNIAYWVSTNREERPDYRWHRMSPAELATILPFTKSTIARALDHLHSQGVLEREQEPGWARGYRYAFKEEKMLQRSLGTGRVSKTLVLGSKSEMHSQKSEIHDSKSEMDGSNPDNNTYCKDTIVDTIGRDIKRHNYLERPATPTAASICAFLSGKSDALTQPQGQVSLASNGSAGDGQLKADSGKTNEAVTPQSTKITLPVSVPASSPSKSEVAQQQVPDLRRCIKINGTWYGESFKSDFDRKQEEQARINAEIEEHEQKRKQCASKTQGKEHCAALTSREKAEVLKNALVARNKAGEFDHRGVVTNQVFSFNAPGIKAAEQFFAVNPHWTVADFVDLMGCCSMTALNRVKPDEGEFDEAFYIRRGVDLSFMLCNFEKILCDTGLWEGVPEFVAPSKEEMFGKAKHKRKKNQ